MDGCFFSDIPAFRKHATICFWFRDVSTDITKLSIHDSKVLMLDLGRFFSFLILYTVSRTAWTGDQPVARPLHTHRTTQTKNKRTQTYVPWVGFELTILVFERAQTVRVLNRAATLIILQRGIINVKWTSTCAKEAWKDVTAQNTNE
jgi:hypothetical protein